MDTTKGEKKFQEKGKGQKMVGRDKKRRLRIFVLAGTLLCCIMAVGTLSYMVQKRDGLINRFFPGSVEVTLSGWEWGAKEVELLPAGETLTLNPIVENRGTMDAWVFVKMCIPVEEIICIDTDTQRKSERTSTELLSFVLSEKWEQLQRKSMEKQVEYIFGYQQKLPAGRVTTPFWKEIRMANYLEGQLDPKIKYNVSMETIAVQGTVTKEGEGLQAAYRYVTGGEML